MSLCCHLIIAGLVVLADLGQSAETAHARLWCLSLRFQQGEGDFGDTLDLSTINSTANGELAPTFGTPPFYSYFSMDYAGYPISGVIYLALPPRTDANQDGFSDFFDVSQSVSGSSSGNYETSVSTGSITAGWSRGADSKDGVCSLRFVDDVYGDLGTFRHSFGLLEYTGALLFSPGPTNVSCTVHLTQTGNSANELQGPLRFVKDDADPFNELTLQSGSWTNAALQELTFVQNAYFRDAEWPTNYFGYFEFPDGEPNTSEPDYSTWMLSIDDLNDADHDTIPDFSDVPPVVLPPRRPQLGLTLGTTRTNLLLTIHGDVNHFHSVQELAPLTATNWQTVVSVMLTNDPQVISLPKAVGAPKFWRVVSQ